jgi:hypothetical protein
MNTPHPADQQIAALHRAQAAHPRFAATSCSQCGTDTGPGDSGFSSCGDHRARDLERAFFRTVAGALQPRDVKQRHCYDADLGSYTGSPADPRTDDADEEDFDAPMTPAQAHDEATDQILSFAESVADWMAKACDTPAGRLPLDVRGLEPLQIIEGSPALLVSVLMNGDNSQVLRAVYRLREMAAKNFAAEIDERAAELLAAAL